MEYVYLVENVCRDDMSLEEVLSLIGEGEAVVVMTSGDCNCGRGVCRVLRERYNLKERLRVRNAGRLLGGDVVVVGCYDEKLGKAVAVVVVVTRGGFWMEEELFMYDGLQALACVANRYNFRRLFLVCETYAQSTRAYDLSLCIFKNKYKGINVVVVSEFI